MRLTGLRISAQLFENPAQTAPHLSLQNQPNQQGKYRPQLDLNGRAHLTGLRGHRFNLPAIDDALRKNGFLAGLTP